MKPNQTQRAITTRYAAGVVIILREHRLGLRRGRARKNMTPQG